MAGLFEHLMVPLDFTPKNDAAVKVVKDLALRDQAKVTLVHVVEAIDNTQSGEFAEFYEMLKEKACGRMESYAEALRVAGIEVAERLVVGRPVEAILEEIKQLDVDLLVLSSHQVELSKGARNWGTLSYQLSILSPCPALLVK
ncbi:MAG: universal stress protein [Aeoliella sp.]